MRDTDPLLHREIKQSRTMKPVSHVPQALVCVCLSASFHLFLRGRHTLGRWRGVKMIHAAAQCCQSPPWKHMADRQARRVTILTWH